MCLSHVVSNRCCTLSGSTTSSRDDWKLLQAHPRFRYFALNTEMRCVLYRQDVSMFISIHMMLSCQWKSSEIWSVVKGRHSPTVSCTTQPVYAEQGTTGSSSEVTSLPWWIRSVCPRCSSLTVLQTFSGRNWHASSVLRIVTPAQLTTKLSKRTPPLLTGSSTIALSSSSMPSTPESLVPVTTGSASSGSIAAVLMSSACSAAYCLHTSNGQQKCRFGYPKPLQPETALVMEDEDPVLLTARNDSLINSFNPVQLSAWRANVDIQYCVSRRKVINYCAKYATKCEPRSQSLKEIFTTIVRSLKEDSSSLKTVQKLLISSVGERDFSAQETCHLLLQLPMFKASRDFVVLSLDGSRAVHEHLDEDQPATVPSALDNYISRPTTIQFENITLLQFVQDFTMRQECGLEPSKRRKKVVVIVRPYCPPDPNGPKYEQYCQQKLMLYVPFRHQSELLSNHTTFTAAYAEFLQSDSIPPSLEDDIHRLQQSSQEPPGDDTEVSGSVTY